MSMDRVSQPVPDARGFESHFLNRYEKSRIRRHVAVTLVTMFMPKVPDYTVTFISSLSSAVPDTQNDVFDLVLHLFQTNEDATSKSMFQLHAHFPDSTNLDEAYVQASKNKTHAQIMLHSVVLPTLTGRVVKEGRRQKVLDRNQCNNIPR